MQTTTFPYLTGIDMQRELARSKAGIIAKEEVVVFEHAAKRDFAKAVEVRGLPFAKVWSSHRGVNRANDVCIFKVI